MEKSTWVWPSRIVILALLLAPAMQGCQPRAAIDDRALNYPLPEQWQSSTSQTPGPTVTHWLAALDVAELDALIQEALDKNLALRRTGEGVHAARAMADLMRSQTRPHVGIAMEGRWGESSTKQGGQRNHQSQVRYNGLLTISWEIDVWGRLADQAAAAQADLFAAQADLAAARLSVAARVAKTWLEGIAAGQMLRLARQTEQSYALGTRKVRERFERGLATALDMRQAELYWAAARGSLLRREEERTAAARRLQQLIGRYPDGRLTVQADFPELSTAIPAGLPADMLERRPDLQASLRRLAATDHRVAASRKAFLPQVRLTGDAGAGGSHLRNSSPGRHTLWDLAGGLTQPVFQGGRLMAQWAEAGADARKAWIDYVQTLETALAEVEQALDNESRSNDRLATLALAAVQADRAGELALQYYGSGRLDLLNVLEAQRRAYAAHMERIETSAWRLQNRVDLHLALGGDFIDPMAVEHSGPVAQ
jgi:outer membrane protein, multidrug efflux system